MTTAQKERFAMCLLTSPTSKAACEKAGITEKTATRVKHDKEFQKIYAELRIRIQTQVSEKATSLMSEALDSLADIMRDKKCTDNARVKAATTILQIGMKKITESEETEMKKSIDVQISSYLRLAELCGTGDDNKRKEYMAAAEALLKKAEAESGASKNGCEQ